MIVLLGNGGGSAKRSLLETRPDLGNLLSPLGWRTPVNATWACDNDVFAAWQKSLDTSLPIEKREFWADYWRPCGQGEERWFRMLEKQPYGARFTLLPDKVADWQETVKKAYRFRQELCNRDLRCAIALQDGCRFEEALDLCPDVVFVGGSKRWKWTQLEEICRYFPERGVAVHVGRVSGVKGIAECLRIEKKFRLKKLSCDGTGWVRAPARELPRLLRALEGCQSAQQTMNFEDGA